MTPEEKRAYAVRCRQSGCDEEFTAHLVQCEEERRVSAEADAMLAQIVAAARKPRDAAG